MPIPATNLPGQQEQLSADSDVVQVVSAAVINNGGTDAVQGQIYDVIGGVLGPNGTPCRLRVTAAAGGVATAIEVDQMGSYQAPLPLNPVSLQTSIGGAASTVTADLTFTEESVAVLDRRITSIVIPEGATQGVVLITTGTSSETLVLNNAQVGLQLAHTSDTATVWLEFGLNAGVDISANAFPIFPRSYFFVPANMAGISLGANEDNVSVRWAIV